MAILLLLAVMGSGGTISSYLLDSMPLFNANGDLLRRVPKKELPKSPAIVATNASGQLGIELTDGSVVYLRRNDVSYTGTPPGPCRVVSAAPQSSNKTLSAGDTGANRGAGEGKRGCVAD